MGPGTWLAMTEKMNRRQRRELQFGKRESTAPPRAPALPRIELRRLVEAMAMATPLVHEAHFPGRQRCLEMSRAGVAVLHAFGFQANLRPVVLVASFEEMVFTCGNPRADQAAPASTGDECRRAVERGVATGIDRRHLPLVADIPDPSLL